MKQSLQLKIGQQLTMTPQLQHAIKLLQLSTLDLQQEIQQALESNPMLELNEDSEQPKETEENNETVDFSSQENEAPKSEQTANTEEPSPDGDWQQNIPDELPVDTQWDDVYQNAPPSTNSLPAGDDGFDIDARNSEVESLQDHLYWQLNLTRMSDLDRMIALAIIDAVDTIGRLTITPEEIFTSFSETYPELELDEVMAVLHRVQQFDPPGVAAADLQDCLLIQLRQLAPDTPWLAEAKTVVTKYLEYLGTRDYTQIMRRSRLKEPQLKAALELIQSLTPNPGESISPNTAEYIAPDVFVAKVKGRWSVELNPDIAPKLRINSGYASLIKRADSSDDNTYLRDNLQEARWFLKSLQSRNETLLKVASKIVEYQRGFLEYGEEAMKPLVLHDIAEAVEMHESTISRVTTQKYMHTPRGIFELKYFFSSHVSTDSGGECSSTAIRALIKKLVAAENPRKPLSDNKIAQLMAEQGINVARRTIAKYRESMNVPPSNERKQLV